MTLSLALVLFLSNAPAPPFAFPNKPVGSLVTSILQGRYATSDDAHQAMTSAQSDIGARNDCMSECYKENDANNVDWSKANQKVYDLRKEMEEALKELREGLYCNQCWRTKSEIEKTGVSFAQHLQDVHGEAVPAPPEKMAEKEKSYRDQIAQAEKETDQYKQTWQGLVQRWENCRDERISAENTYYDAQYWEGVLKAREENERRKQALAEKARKLMEYYNAVRAKQAAELQQRLQMMEEQRQAGLATLDEQMKSLTETTEQLRQTLGGYVTPDQQAYLPTTPPFDESGSTIAGGWVGNYNNANFNSAGSGASAGGPAGNGQDSSVTLGSDSSVSAYDWISQNIADPKDILKEMWKYRNGDPSQPMEMVKEVANDTLDQVQDQVMDKVKEVGNTIGERATADVITGGGIDDATRNELHELGVWDTVKDNWSYINASVTQSAKKRVEMIRNNIKRIRHFYDYEIDKLSKLFDQFNSDSPDTDYNTSGDSGSDSGGAVSGGLVASRG